MILITAAGGKVGQHLVEQLSKQGTKALAGFHSEAKAKALKVKGIESVVLDLGKPDTIATALKGIEKVFLVTQGAPTQTEQELNVVREAKKAGVKHLAKLSVHNAESEAFSFAKWSRAVEKEIEKSGIPYTFLRPNYFMQNFFGSADSIKKFGGWTGGPASYKITPIDARDIAAMAAAVLTEEGHAGKAYDVNGPQSLNGPELAEIFTKVLGKPVKYMDTPLPEFKKQLGSWGLPGWMVEAYVDLTANYMTGAGVGSSADVEKVLHRKPISLEQFLKDNLAAFQG
jgi:uncharacterized protein YbjT (DUF2867 family)